MVHLPSSLLFLSALVSATSALVVSVNISAPDCTPFGKHGIISPKAGSSFTAFESLDVVYCSPATYPEKSVQIHIGYSGSEIASYNLRPTKGNFYNVSTNAGVGSSNALLVYEVRENTLTKQARLFTTSIPVTVTDSYYYGKK